MRNLNLLWAQASFAGVTLADEFHLKYFKQRLYILLLPLMFFVVLDCNFT